MSVLTRDPPASPSPPTASPLACPACGAIGPGGPAPWLEKDGYRIVVCRSCDMGFYTDVVSLRGVEHFYSAAYFTDGGAGYPGYLRDESARRQQARHYLGHLATLGMRPPGRLLDVGCASGFLVDEARRAGWEAAGCDVSEYATDYARDELGLDVVCADFLAVDYPATSFDVVTVCTTLAHLPQPRAVAEKLAALVKPGGCLLLESPDRGSPVARTLGRRWPFLAPPTVLFYHTRRSLCQLLAPPTWRLLSYRPTPKWVTVRHVMAAIEHALPLLPSRPLQAVAGSALGDRLVPYRLGDIALVAFRRE